MTKVDKINNLYFEWLYDLVCDGRFGEDISYRKLIMQLHATEFVWDIPMDENRAHDGLELRYRFAFLRDPDNTDISEDIIGPCSVLEMMVALAIRCEETIMDDAKLGDRTGQWFWGMINNLGLNGMYDSNYDKAYVTEVINRLLDRDYRSDGKGGLFIIKNCGRDLRDVEIWYQLCWYLDNFIGG